MSLIGTARPGKLSYLAPTWGRQLLDWTVGDAINYAAKKWRDLPAIIVSGEGQLTFRDIETQTKIIACGLAELGLVKGNILVPLAHNTLEMCLIRLACSRLGIALVNLQPEIELSDFEYAFNIVGANCLYLGETWEEKSNYDKFLKIIPEMNESECHRINSKILPTLSHVITTGSQKHPCTFSYDEMYKKASESKWLEKINELEELVQFDDLYCIRFTSGTTGKPKPITLNHHGVVNDALYLGDLYSLGPKDRNYNIHNVSLTMNAFGILSALIYGSSIVLAQGPEVYDSYSTVNEIILKEKCTHFYCDPNSLRILLKNQSLKKNPMSSLKLVWAILDGLPLNLAQQVQEKFPVPIIGNHHGMTEVGGIFHFLPTDSIELRTSTVGYPSPLFEVKLINEKGKIVPIGEPGELCLRGIRVITGKFGTTVLDSDNWFHTGDMMVMLESGHCKHLARIKDLINLGTHKVIPCEVEEFLNKHPKVHEAQVFGVTSQNSVHVAAWIALKKNERMTSEDVHAFCEDKFSAYKIPKYIHFVEKFERQRGKIEKAKLREKTKELFKL